jgi:hypothetical protein
MLEGTNGTLCFYPGAFKGACFSNTVTTGKWMHIVATYTGANAANNTDIALYINGVQLTPDSTISPAMTPRTIASSVGIGGTYAPGQKTFPGYMSEFAMYSTALTAAKVQNHYQSSLIAKKPTILATPGNNSVTLTWSAPEVSGGTPPVGYRISRCSGTLTCTPTVLVSNTNSTVTTFQDLAVTNGTVYVYQVAALNTATNTTQVGPFSTTVSALPGTLPGPPPTLAAVPGTSNIALTWTAPTASPSVIGYQYSYAGSNGVYSEPILFSGTTLTYNQTGLTPGATYTFRVQALNANGYGPFATIQSGPLSGVAGLTGTSGNGNVLLTWRPPSLKLLHQWRS